MRVSKYKEQLYAQSLGRQESVPLHMKVFLVTIALIVLGGTNDTLLAKYQVIFIGAYAVMSVALSVHQIHVIGRSTENMMIWGYLVWLIFLVGLIYSLDKLLTLRFSIYFLLYLLCMLCYLEWQNYAALLSIIRICAQFLAFSIIASAIFQERFVNAFSFWLENDSRVLQDIRYGQFSGLIGDRSFAAMAMCTGIYVELSCVLAQGKIRRKNVLFTLVCLAAMFLTGKRITIVMVLCGLAMGMIVSNDKVSRKIVFRVALVITIISVVVLFVAPQTKIVLYRLLGGLSDTTFNDRTQFWAVAWAMFLQKPVLGWGIGSYLQYNLVYGTGIKQYAHNMYLQLLAETGIIGFLAIMALFVFAFVLTFRTVRIQQNEQSGLSVNPVQSETYSKKAVCLFSLMSQTGFLAYGLTGYPFYNLQQGFFYAVCVAMVLSLAKESAVRSR